MDIFNNFNKIFDDLEEITELARKIDKQSKQIKNKLINKNNYE